LEEIIEMKKRVSIIEVLMVILIVGIVVIIVFPSIDAKKKTKIISMEVYPTFDLIQEQNNQFFEENGYYPFLSQLNIPGISDKQYFSYDLTDSTLTATSLQPFGRTGAVIVYNYIDNQWSVEGTEGVIKEFWLP
jgi:competence protein ComGC